MRCVWLGLILSCLGLSTAGAGEGLSGTPLSGGVLLVGSERKGYTGADHSGLVWEIFRLVFEPAGLEVRTDTMPYTRALGLVAHGAADAWVGAYPEETEGALFPRWHYAADVIAALGLASTPEPTLRDLGRYRLIWMRGYAFDKYLPQSRHHQEILSYNGVLFMLERGHADYLIAARSQLEGILARAGTPHAYRITDLTLLPLYPGFSDTPRGRQLAELYDRRMAELVRSGELRPIYERWRQPYPFD